VGTGFSVSRNKCRVTIWAGGQVDGGLGGSREYLHSLRSCPRLERQVTTGNCTREFTLVPVAEFVLGKRRILEIYLNVVEWGPGIYGAESACRYYEGTAARNLDRQQAARLAAILPAPLKRRPERMNHYSELILERMRQMGW